MIHIFGKKEKDVYVMEDTVHYKLLYLIIDIQDKIIYTDK